MQIDSLSGGSFVTTSAGLTGSGAATTYSTANIIHYSIRGDAATKATVSGGTTPTTDILTSAAITLTPTATAGKARSVVWALASGGTVVTIAGPVCDWDGTNTAPNYGFGASVAELPNIPEDYAPFAVSVVKVAPAASAWTFGSSNWNATGATVAHHNILLVPPRPFLV